MKTKKVVPIIINGELNDNESNKGKKKKVKVEKLPTKQFTFLDVLLTLVGFAIIIYGITTLIPKKEKEEPIDASNDINEEKEELEDISLAPLVTLNLDESINTYTTEDLNNMSNGLLVSSLSNNAILSLAARNVNWHKENEVTYLTYAELDEVIHNLFGEINYVAEPFTYGTKSYTYNQSTSRYELLEDQKLAHDFKMYYHIDEQNDGTNIIVREYIAYTNAEKSWTIGNLPLSVIIDDLNIDSDYSQLKCFEYHFVKSNDKYLLQQIAIK